MDVPFCFQHIGEVDSDWLDSIEDSFVQSGIISVVFQVEIGLLRYNNLQAYVEPVIASFKMITQDSLVVLQSQVASQTKLGFTTFSDNLINACLSCDSIPMICHACQHYRLSPYGNGSDFLQGVCLRELRREYPLVYDQLHSKAVPELESPYSDHVIECVSSLHVCCDFEAIVPLARKIREAVL